MRSSCCERLERYSAVNWQAGFDASEDLAACNHGGYIENRSPTPDEATRRSCMTSDRSASARSGAAIRSRPLDGVRCLAIAIVVAAVAGVSNAAAQTAQATYDTTAFAALRWREVGPYRGGRSVAGIGSAQRPLEYWMGTSGGGVFKTTDGGINWQPMSDKYFSGTIGAIAVDPKNPDIVWVGGGETCIRGNVSHGDGVWMTKDGGKTWSYMGLRETEQIAAVNIDPRNSDVVYVSALGPTRSEEHT